MDDAHHPMLKKHRYHRAHTANRRMTIRPIFTDFHRLEMHALHEYPRHRHANYEAILVERGPYLCELNGRELRLRAGEVLIIKPGDWHADHLRAGQRHFVLHFTLEASEGIRAPDLFTPGARPEDQVARGDFKRDARLLHEIQVEAEAGADYAAAVQDGLLAALFWRWARGLPERGLSAPWRALPAAEARRQEIAEVLAKHVTQNPTVAELAQTLGVSPRQFTTQCRTLFGESPAKLLLDLKLREAEAMLRYQGRRVSEVSEALGFANPFHFSRVCRRAWGRAPSAVKTS
jgi:AraC-like DNA-binding protein/mannose-6-phosphate isomerase-like protein (cupin superfamily)